MRVLTAAFLVLTLLPVGHARAAPPTWMGDGQLREARAKARKHGKPILLHVYDGE